MIGALQVHHLEPYCFPAEVIFVSEENIHFDLADWRARQAGYDTMEHSPAWHELLRLDVQLLHGVTVQYVDAAPTVNQYTGETGSSPFCREGGV